MSHLKFYKCNIIGGFRLSDLHMNISSQDKNKGYFSLESHVAEASKAVKAAIKAKWMVEVTEKEASQFLKIPRINKAGIQDSQAGTKKAINRTQLLGTPDVSEVNKSLEVRQARANKLINENSKKRFEDSVNNIGTSSDVELMKNETEDVATPILEKESKIQVKKETLQKEEQPKKLEKDLGKKIKKAVDEPVKDLVDNDIFDNSGVSTPELIKDENDVKKTLDKKITRKKMAKRRGKTGRKSTKNKSE